MDWCRHPSSVKLASVLTTQSSALHVARIPDYLYNGDTLQDTHAHDLFIKVPFNMGASHYNLVISGQPSLIPDVLCHAPAAQTPNIFNYILTNTVHFRTSGSINCSVGTMGAAPGALSWMACIATPATPILMGKRSSSVYLAGLPGPNMIVT